MSTDLEKIIKYIKNFDADYKHSPGDFFYVNNVVPKYFISWNLPYEKPDLNTLEDLSENEVVESRELNAPKTFINICTGHRCNKQGTDGEVIYCAHSFDLKIYLGSWKLI